MKRIFIILLILMGIMSCKMFSAMETLYDFTETSIEYIYDEATEG